MALCLFYGFCRNMLTTEEKKTKIKVSKCITLKTVPKLKSYTKT